MHVHCHKINVNNSLRSSGIQMADIKVLFPLGADWEFIEKPPEQFQSDCPVCLLHLWEPYQATCCGYSFCQACIEKVKIENGPCPCCKVEGYKIFPNKGLRRSLYKYKVHCCYQKKGCPWIGALGDLEGHLNMNPTQEIELEGCQFVEVDCSYNCSKLILRSELEVHKTEKCSKRPFSCEYCKNYNSTYGDVIYHWSQCGHYLIQCPQCHKSVKRQDRDDHIMNDCPETTVQCDFKHFGCDVEIPRKDMPTHIDRNLALHMRYMSQMVTRLEAENKQLQDKVSEQQEEVAKVKKELKYAPINTSGTILTMNDLEHHKTSGDPWISPSFYIHGYHLYLQVYVNVHDDTTDTLCMTVFIRLKQGRFDNNVKWPFRGEVTVEMLKEDDGGYEVLHTHRIVHEIKPENVNSGRGVTAIHPSLLRHVTNNRLHFRVPAVWLTNTN